MAIAELPPPLALFRMATGYYVSRAIYVAAKLAIADLLSDGPRHYDALAQATGTHGPSLNRVLRLLATRASTRPASISRTRVGAPPPTT